MSEIPEIVRTFKWDENLDVKDKHIILGKLLAYQDIEEYCKTIRESYTRLLKVNNTETEEDIASEFKSFLDRYDRDRTNATAIELAKGFCSDDRGLTTFREILELAFQLPELQKELVSLLRKLEIM